MTTPIHNFDNKLVRVNVVRPELYARHRRYCIRETFCEGPAPGCINGLWLKVWAYTYSDGTVEQLKRVIEK